MTDIARTGGTGQQPPQLEPDAHGQAALMLSESILHALVETSVITVEQAVSIVQTAQEVKAEVAKVAGESRQRMEESLHLLSRIGISLETDLH